MKYPLKQTEHPVLPFRTQYFMEHPEQFSIARLASNEMDRGDGLTPLAKIPDIEDRIRFTRDGGGYFTEVRLVIGRETDEKTGEAEEETVVLGHTSKGMLYGMMTTSDIYHDYFDTSGNLIYDPMDPEEEMEEEPEDTEPENEEPEDEDSEETTDETEKPPLKTLNNQDNPDNGQISDISDQSTALLSRSSEEELRRQVAEELQKKNWIKLGDTILVRYPNVNNVSTLKANKQGVRRVQYIYEQWYDPEIHQCRNRKTSIGQMSEEFPGAMIPNERYKQYFNMETGLPLSRDEQNSTSADFQNPETEETGERAKAELQKTVERYGINSEEAFSAAADYLHQLLPENKDTVMENHNNDIQDLYSQTRKKKQRLDSLGSILGAISETIDMLAKKYPDDLIGTYKARKINEILSEIKHHYLGSGYEEFLELIKEPEEVKKDGETYVTGMSYSDVQILLDHYTTLLWRVSLY